MSKKDRRLDAIRMILSQKKIQDQAQLIKALSKYGITASQATISNDLRMLHVIRKRTNEGWEFYLPGTRILHRVPSPETVSAFKYAKIFKDFHFSPPIGVIHVEHGHASYVAKDIDEMNSDLIIGTVAGLDTILLVCKEGIKKKELSAFLASMFPSLVEDD